jgi:methionine synthase I (cobalamin-dependent)
LSVAKTTAAAAASGVLHRLFAGEHVLCDGAMGTMLFGRGFSSDGCCDELNLSQPGTVAAVHAEYLQAGAEIIETNTFGANAFRLERYGLRDKVREVNLAGVRIARGCVVEKDTEACVAGAIGPLGVRLDRGQIDTNEVRAAFAEQIRALAEGGPGVGADLLMIETMISLAEAGEAIRAARDVAPGLRLVVTMTVDEDGKCLDGASAETAAAGLTDLGADAVGCNCSFGPASVLRAIEQMRGATRLPLVAMPNAGLPYEGAYLVSPEEMGRFARRLVEAGASLVGGCCGTTPEHTRAMKAALDAVEVR